MVPVWGDGVIYLFCRGGFAAISLKPSPYKGEGAERSEADEGGLRKLPRLFVGAAHWAARSAGGPENLPPPQLQPDGQSRQKDRLLFDGETQEHPVLHLFRQTRGLIPQGTQPRPGLLDQLLPLPKRLLFRVQEGLDPALLGELI